MKSQHATNGTPTFCKMTNRLRELRLAKKMTQATLAEELDMPRGSYSLLESGVTLPTVVVLKTLTNAFNCKDIEIYSGVYLDIIRIESSDD
ncbi:hypothetical protein LCGC14_0448770 [marine sediment metagenome]|uniref:HTH cro/C1-type domain-containing protein n=1 Tax=marine sediment metagenome TaxID=412755 RepID=A0A0F9V567_9ZZZZ